VSTISCVRCSFVIFFSVYCNVYSKDYGFNCFVFIAQGFTYPVRAHFLEDVLEMTGYKLTSFNQIDDYGQEKLWKTQKQLAPRKRKNQITSLVEVCCNLKNLAINLCTSSIDAQESLFMIFLCICEIVEVRNV